MKAPVGWLRDYVDLPESSHEIAELLASIGFPVDAIEPRPELSNVVVGRIDTLQKHPNADRLQVAKVDIGLRQPLNIATAATNVAVGQMIAVAMIGAQLPNLKIERRKMRGFESEGMMISADELGLPADWFEDGILQMDAETLLGADVISYFRLRDDVLDVDITTNRPDAMSMTGLARELAAATGKELRLPPELQHAEGRIGARDRDAKKDADGPAVSIRSADCTRFVAQRFSNITVRQSPLWMRVRLALAGQRPINNIVDVSNYVMLEVGQPLHFYDAAHLSGNHLIARDAAPGEKLVTLDDVEHELFQTDLVIADEQAVQGLAGIKGGKNAEVTAGTRKIILEAANFNGARIRRMSAAHGFRTDASTRHEKTLAPILTDLGAARAATLLIAEGAAAHAPHAFGDSLQKQTPVHLPLGEPKRLLGFDLNAKEIRALLSPLGFNSEQDGDQALLIQPPAWRNDVTISADVVEEIARMAGYDRVPMVMPAIATHDIASAAYHLENRIAYSLEALGYYEIVSYSLQGAGVRQRFSNAGLSLRAREVEIRNPLSAEQTFLRSALEPGILDHFARMDQPIKIFELGHVFEQGDRIEEIPMLAMGWAVENAREPNWRDSAFLQFKGDCEELVRRLTGRKPEASRDTYLGMHPGKCATLSLDGVEIMHLGAADPRLLHGYEIRRAVYLAVIPLTHIPEPAIPQYRPGSRFPSTTRDLALVVALEVSAKAIEQTIASTIGDLGKSVRVFDEYRGPQVGENQKSLAARMVLQRDDTTITDEEADEAVARALSALKSELGAEIRS